MSEPLHQPNIDQGSFEAFAVEAAPERQHGLLGRGDLVKHLRHAEQVECPADGRIRKALCETRDLLRARRRGPPRRWNSPPRSDRGGGRRRGARRSLGGFERDAIVQALENTRYNETAAAKLLGMLSGAAVSYLGSGGVFAVETAVKPPICWFHFHFSALRP